MRRISQFSIALFAAGLICLGQQSRAWWQSVPQISAGAAAFSGPGDVIASAVTWGSCARAYTAAFAATAAAICDIVDTATGTATCTLKIGTNGFADLTTAVCPTATPTVGVTTWCTVTNVAGCSITKIYDQTGNARHFTQATLSNMPLLLLSAINSLPGIACTNAASTNIATATLTQAQAFNMAAVYSRTGNNTTAMGIFGTQTTAAGLETANATNTARVNAGTALDLAGVTDGSFHAIQGVFNGASSVTAVDSLTPTTGNAGTNGPSANAIRLCRSQAGQSFTGTVMEGGLWPGGAWNSTQYGNINSNAHGTSGYNF